MIISDVYKMLDQCTQKTVHIKILRYIKQSIYRQINRINLKNVPIVFMSIYFCSFEPIFDTQSVFSVTIVCAFCIDPWVISRRITYRFLYMHLFLFQLIIVQTFPILIYNSMKSFTFTNNCLYRLFFFLNWWDA